MSIPSWAYVGAKVVCIKRGLWRDILLNPSSPLYDYGELYPVYGGHYTIRGLRVHPYGVAVWLAEIINTPRLYSGRVIEKAFDIMRFRPFVSQSEDIAMIKRFIEPSTILERLDAALERLG